MSDTTSLDPTEGVAHHVGNVDSLRLALGLCLCYTLCFTCLRIYIRWRAYGVDDLIVALSMTLAMGFFSCSYIASHAGLGHLKSSLANEPQSTIHRLNVATLAGNVIWILSLCLSKGAVVTILMRTSQTPVHRRLQWATLALISVQCIASIVLITAACKVGQTVSWDFKANENKCAKQDMRWQAITGLDVATEVVLLVLPVHLTWKLQMSLKMKAIVVTAFWLRIPTIAFTALRDMTTHDLTKTSDVFLDGALVLIWQAVELSYSLAAVTIAALKSFTETLNTGFGHGELVRVHGNSEAYKMSDMSANSRTAKSKSLTSTITSIGAPQPLDQTMANAGPRPLNDNIMLRPEGPQNSATIYSTGSRPPSNHHGLRNTEGSTDYSSDENIIMQEIQYSVRYDEAPLCQRR